MKHEIDKLIANILLDEGEVSLPGVGTLILVRHAAQRLSSKLLQLPYRELRFTKEERGIPFAAYIERVAGVPIERAEDIYDEYVAQSLREGVFTIEGLCTIKNGSVQTFPEFEAMVNQEPRRTVQINPRTNYFVYVIASLCMVFAIGIAAYIFYTSGMLNTNKKACVATKDSAVVEQPMEATTEQVAAVEETTETIVTAEPVESVVAEPVAAILPMQRGMSYAVWGVYNVFRHRDAPAYRRRRDAERLAETSGSRCSYIRLRRAIYGCAIRVERPFILWP